MTKEKIKNILTITTSIFLLIVVIGISYSAFTYSGVGQKANLCVFDLNEKFVIKKEDLVSKASNTPFIGYPCYGKIKYNMIDGKLYQF